MNKANSAREGMMLLAEKAPHVYYMHGSRIKTMLQERVGTLFSAQGHQAALLRHRDHGDAGSARAADVRLR